MADLRLPLVLGDEDAVGEVERPDGELSRHERHPEAVHRAEELSVELEPQLVTAIAKEHEIDRERPDPVADDHPHRPLVEVDDQKDGRADRDQEVRNSRDGEQDRPLLDAEQRRQLLVVQLRPEPDERGTDEPGLAVAERERVGDRLRGDPAGGEPERGARHREPERGPHDTHPVCQLGRVEVEAEESARDPEPQQHDEHGRQRRQRLDPAVVSAVQVARVERQQQHREDPRDQAAQPIDQGLREEALDLLR